MTHTTVSCQLTYCKLALVLLRRFQDTSSSEENRWVTSSSATASHPFLKKYITSARLKRPPCWPASSSSMEVFSLRMIPAWGNESSFHTRGMDSVDSKETKIHVLFRNSSPPTPSTIISSLCLIYVLAFNSRSYFSNPRPYNTTKLLKKGKEHSEKAANKTLGAIPTTCMYTPRNGNSVLPRLQRPPGALTQLQAVLLLLLLFSFTFSQLLRTPSSDIFLSCPTLFPLESLHYKETSKCLDSPPQSYTLCNVEALCTFKLS